MDDGHNPAQDHWCYPSKAATIAAEGADDNFLGMFGNYTYVRADIPSSEHLFELVWERGTGKPSVSRLRSLPLATTRSVPPPEPPHSKDVMVALPHPIISGEDHADDNLEVLAKVKSEPSVGTMVSIYKGKIPAMDYDMSSAMNTNTGSHSSEWRKAASGWSSRTSSSQHSGTHDSAGKSGRCKMTDRLRTLQQLVPGCYNSNEESTLEQTIHYMKLLQQQVQSMNMRPAASAVAAAVYPTVTMPIPAAATGQVWPVPAVPYAHYHAVMMHAGAAAPVMMPAPATEHCCSREAVLHFHGAAGAAQEGEREGGIVNLSDRNDD